ncbi:MAG: nucleotidyltransferase domain-containing protein [Desulfobacteraceae bacterium]
MTRFLFNPAEISFAFMHGSFVDGGFFRDIDVGVFVTGVDSADFWEYETRISQQIEEALYSKFLVEVKVINEAPVSFCYHVIKGQVLYVRDGEALMEFMVRISKDYLDMALLRHRYMTEVMNSL